MTVSCPNVCFERSTPARWWVAIGVWAVCLGGLIGPGVGCGVAAQETSSGAVEEETGGEGDGEGVTGKSETGEGKEKGKPNRLADETSPYLLLHAHNPVDWYPWGPEALAKARDEGKLIFLSVGYSSCHWCHVMEREAFSDPEIAAYLNEHFVCIKVDREERPDIDHIYMTSLYVFNQLAKTGAGGGWPLSMFLTPEAKPFFGATYLPARDGDRGNQTGFLTLVGRIQGVWEERPEALEKDAETITQVTRQQLSGDRVNPLFRLNDRRIVEGVENLVEQFDPEHGGFGYDRDDPRRPKFPEPSNLLLLLSRLESDRDQPELRKILETTLDKLAQGGIYDQLGGGFHRYSVDRYWHIPHFEKMLYDNAQLISVYARGYRLSGNPAYRRVVEETIGFCDRELAAPGGGYWSALDADSEGEEGKYYRWTADELKRALTDEQWTSAAATWGIAGEPNFEDQDWVLLLADSLAVVAERQGVTEAEWVERLAPIKFALLEARDQRERPLTDTKILTAWNGLMIRGLADAGRLLEEPEYVVRGEATAEAILERLQDDAGRLYRTQGGGEPELAGYLDDYALLVDGLLALHEATGKQRWLDEAERLMETQIELFWDEEQGGFFYTAEDHESLLARAKNPVDNVIPSGNSVATRNLVRLGRELEREEWLDLAERSIRSVANLLHRSPQSVPCLLEAVGEYLEVRPERADRPTGDSSGAGEEDGQ